jgi:hypothetical protein
VIVAVDAASATVGVKDGATTSAADEAKNVGTVVGATSARNAVPPTAQHGPSAKLLHAGQRQRRPRRGTGAASKANAAASARSASKL